MKSKKTFICLFLPAIFFFTVFTSAMVPAKEYAEPVQRLKKLYKTDKTFKKKLDLALAHVQDKPDGTPNPWKGKTVNHLYDFFNDWYYFLPVTTDSMTYIGTFSWFFYKNPYALKVVREEPGLSWTRAFVEARGTYMDSSESVKTIPEWLHAPGTHMEQFIVPPGGFKSFNEFFVRRLKTGVRPITAPTDDSVVVAPADCMVQFIYTILTTDSRIPVKGRVQLNVKELLSGSSFAEKFVKGTAVGCFLPADGYHHYHAPVTGQVVHSRQDVAGVYFGVEDGPGFLKDSDFSYFERFRRGFFVIETRQYGYVGMVVVGLTTIGSIQFVEKYRDVKPGKPVPVCKGDRFGNFAYGG
ncbi:MAG: phosphatidylserine decarboxylase, partial [bacterium]|nr:phosphatidylserine decarboxylase [bacterium]